MAFQSRCEPPVPKPGKEPFFPSLCLVAYEIPANFSSRPLEVLC